MSDRCDRVVTFAVSPPSGTSGIPSLTATVDASATTYGSRIHPDNFQANALSDAEQVPAGLLVKSLYLHVSGQFTVKVTTAAHSQQVLSVDDLLVMACQWDPITSLKITGTGAVELLLVGDAA